MKTNGISIFFLVCAVFFFSLTISEAQAQSKHQTILVVPLEYDSLSSSLMDSSQFEEIFLGSLEGKVAAHFIAPAEVITRLEFTQLIELRKCDELACYVKLTKSFDADFILLSDISRIENDWSLRLRLVHQQSMEMDADLREFIPGNLAQFYKSFPNIFNRLAKEAQKKAAPRAQASLIRPEVRPLAHSKRNKSKQTRSARHKKKQQAARRPPSDLRSDWSRSAVGADADLSSELGVSPGAPFLNRDLSEGANPQNASLSGGSVVMTLGTVLGVLGAAISAGALLECETGYCYRPDGDMLFFGGLLETIGAVMLGIGSNKYLNGRARNLTGDPRAKGYARFHWMGWVLAPAGIILTAMLAYDDPNDRRLAYVTLLGGVGGSMAVFLQGAFSDTATARLSDGTRIPFTVVPMLYSDKNSGTKTKGLNLAFEF